MGCLRSAQDFTESIRLKTLNLSSHSHTILKSQAEMLPFPQKITSGEIY